MTTVSESPSARKPRDILITLDVDWAPDWMIADVADCLREAGVRATWFATHKSGAIEELESDGSFEVGAHPNFLSGSGHGVSQDEVLRRLRDWFPAARAVRTHSLFQSEPLMALMANEYGFETDCSIFLPGAAGVQPHRIKLSENGQFLTRLPHTFQDNMYAINGGAWTVDADWLHVFGLKVLNFHPIHIALNTDRLSTYEALKRGRNLRDLKREDVLVNNASPGAGTFFRELISTLKGTGTQTVSAYVTRWIADRNAAEK